MSATDDLPKQLDELSNEKRALLALALDQAGEAFNSFPLSFGQERIWFLEQLAPGTSAYHLPIAVRFHGRLDVAALSRSLNEIVRRHESLRTTFVAPDGHPVQVVAPKVTLALPVVDLQPLQSAQADEAQRLTFAEARAPFDLTRGPLVRIRLLRLSETKHVLLLVLHHIIADGESLRILLRELGALYAAFSTGAHSPLADLPVQYADYAAWQRAQPQADELNRQLAYWQKQLADAPTLVLPTDRSRPVARSGQGARHVFYLPPQTSDGLKALSRRAETTLFMTLLAAFQTLLQRYTGQSDIVVGAPVANRSRPETENLIGFLVNTLALRIDLSGDPGFAEVLKRVRAVCLDAYAHQDAPFEKIVETLRLDRDMSRPPLFQVAFSLQAAPLAASMSGDLALAVMDIDIGAAKFDLTLFVEDATPGLIGTLEYDTDLFEAETIARMGLHFQTLLDGIVADPAQRLSDLPILTEAESHQLLIDWNDTHADYAVDRCVPQLFTAQAERAPDAVAVTCDGAHLTYWALDHRADQLAHQLKRLGVGPESLVALCVEHSLEMIIGALGVLKAGGAYVPLDPVYPEERLAYVLEDSAASVLLTQAHLLARLPAGIAHVICLDADRLSPIANPAPLRFEGRGLQLPIFPDNLAYVIYTSGSTGRPKGVAIPHAGLLNLISWHQCEYAVTPGDRATQLAGPAFDASVWEVWPYLTAGASLHIPSDETRSMPDRLLRWLADEAITLCFLPTPLAESMLAEPWSSSCKLRAVLTGGDRLRRRPPASLACAFVNHYGPTEDTVVTTWTPVAPDDAAHGAPPIGRPIANTQIYILDAHLKPAPIGVPGELCIGGAGLARGYHNRPDWTAEKFVPPLPFLPPSETGRGGGGRLYRTGDLARWLPDGSIEYLGRIDRQVKVRGFRIELGEIEAALSQRPDVRDVVVAARDDIAEDRHLVAYIVPRGEAAPSPDELRLFLRDKLPEYMLPSAFVFMDALPVTPNGKLDRRALPLPDRPRDESDETYLPPSTPIEQRLAEIWRETLEVDRIGLRDNFFQIGGHSLLAARLIARVGDAFNIDLPVRALFEAPTLADLALAIVQKRSEQVEQGTLEQLLSSLEQLSNDEAIRRLAGDRG